MIQNGPHSMFSFSLFFPPAHFVQEFVSCFIRMNEQYTVALWVKCLLLVIENKVLARRWASTRTWFQADDAVFVCATAKTKGW